MNLIRQWYRCVVSANHCSTCHLQYFELRKLVKFLSTYLFHRFIDIAIWFNTPEKLKWPCLSMLKSSSCSFIWSFRPGFCIFSRSTTKILIAFYSWNRMTLVLVIILEHLLVLGNHFLVVKFVEINHRKEIRVICNLVSLHLFWTFAFSFGMLQSGARQCKGCCGCCYLNFYLQESCYICGHRRIFDDCSRGGCLWRSKEKI